MNKTPDLPAELFAVRDAVIEHVYRDAPRPNCRELEYWIHVYVDWGNPNFEIVIDTSYLDFHDSAVADRFPEFGGDEPVPDAARVAFVRDYFGPRFEHEEFLKFPSLHFYPLSNADGETALVACYYYLDAEGLVVAGFGKNRDEVLQDMADGGEHLHEHMKSLSDDEILQLWWPEEPRDGTVAGALDR